MTSYTDVPIDERVNVEPFTRGKNGVRCNLAGTRCIVKWDGDTPQSITDGGYAVRSYQEALEYYQNPINGWATPYVDEVNGLESP